METNNIKIAEYYPSNEGLKNIYSKFIKFGSTIEIPEVGGATIEYNEAIKDSVINSYIEDGETEEMANYIVDYFEYIYGKGKEE